MLLLQVPSSVHPAPTQYSFEIGRTDAFAADTEDGLGEWIEQLGLLEPTHANGDSLQPSSWTPISPNSSAKDDGQLESAKRGRRAAKAGKRRDETLGRPVGGGGSAGRGLTAPPASLPARRA